MKFLVLTIALLAALSLAKGPVVVEARKERGAFPAIIFRQLYDNSSNSLELSPSKRSEFSGGSENGKKFVYILSPISDQIIDLGREFKAELNAFNDNVYTRQTAPNIVSNKLEKPKLLTGNFGLSSQPANECHTIRTTMELVKEELDKKANPTRRRSCKGLVQVNKCEGWCSSSVRPSIKTQTGFKKNCLCCNEGSFRLIQVRLAECFWNDAEPARRISKLEDEPNSFMDVSIEEPSECKCRPCEAGF